MNNKNFDKLMNILCTFIGMLGYFIVGYKAAEIGFSNSSSYFIIILIIIVLLSMFIHVILHEFGHLIAGLKTGYKFVSFRIGSLVLIKDKNNKFKLKKMKISGTLGQCLMCPPKGDYTKIPYKFYHLNGGLINIIIGIIVLIISFIINNEITSCILECFSVLGLSLGLTNIIPNKANGIQNDGYNLLDLSRNDDSKKCINLLLYINAMLTVVDSYKELDKDLVKEIKNIDFNKLDLNNGLIANLYSYQAAIYYAEGNYKKAYEINKDIMNNKNILKLLRNESICECLFFRIINDEKIDDIYTKEIKNYINATMIYPSRQRLMYAYYKYYEKDEIKALDYKKKLEKSIDSYMIKADAICELEIVKKLENNKSIM